MDTLQSKIRMSSLNHGSPTSRPHVVTITSGKGGVGKTHTSINLATTLAARGRKVLIIDADLGLANIDVLLGLKPQARISEVVDEMARIEDVIISYDVGVDVVPASSGIAKLADLSWEDCRYLASEIERIGYGYDYVIVDTGAGIGRSVLFFAAASDEILLVINHETTSITDAYAITKLLSQDYGCKSFSVIVNRNPKGKEPKRAYAKLASVAGRFLNTKMHYLGSISEDSWVEQAVEAQRPFTELAPSCQASVDVRKLCEKIDLSDKSSGTSGGLRLFAQLQPSLNSDREPTEHPKMT